MFNGWDLGCWNTRLFNRCFLRRTRSVYVCYTVHGVCLAKSDTCGKNPTQYDLCTISWLAVNRALDSSLIISELQVEMMNCINVLNSCPCNCVEYLILHLHI